jgi:hypothetical protein
MISNAKLRFPTFFLELAFSRGGIAMVVVSADVRGDSLQLNLNTGQLQSLIHQQFLSHSYPLLTADQMTLVVVLK